MSTRDQAHTALIDDVEAIEQARELAMRLDRIRQLAAHPNVNRAQLEHHRAECNDLVRSISAYLLTVVLG